MTQMMTSGTQDQRKNYFDRIFDKKTCYKMNLINLSKL